MSNKWWRKSLLMYFFGREFNGDFLRYVDKVLVRTEVFFNIMAILVVMKSSGEYDILDAYQRCYQYNIPVCKGYVLTITVS